MHQRKGFEHFDRQREDYPLLADALGRGAFGRAQDSTPLDVASLCAALAPALVERRVIARSLFGRQRADQQRVETFVGLLLDEDDDAGERFLLDHAERTGDPQAVATQLLGPAANLIGDYWRMDVCDFMKVTVVMSRLQRQFWTLASLYPPRGGSDGGRTALLAPLPEEQHGFGLTIVEDAMRRAGWQVDRCGIGEEEAYFDLLSSNDYRIVGVSVSGSALAKTLPAFLRKSRRKSRNQAARFMLGGSLFVERPDLADTAGSDYIALDAPSAVRAAESAVASVLCGS